MFKVIDKSTEVLIVVFMLIISVSVITQVFFRYVLASPLGWTEEISRYGLVWLTFIGMYVVFRRSNHMMITALYSRVSKRIRLAFFLIGYLLMIIFFSYLAVFGFRYSFRMMSYYPDILPIPIGVIYLAVPVGGVLCILNCVQEFFLNIFGKKGIS